MGEIRPGLRGHPRSPPDPHPRRIQSFLEPPRIPDSTTAIQRHGLVCAYDDSHLARRIPRRFPASRHVAGPQRIHRTRGLAAVHAPQLSQRYLPESFYTSHGAVPGEPWRGGQFVLRPGAGRGLLLHGFVDQHAVQVVERRADLEHAGEAGHQECDSHVAWVGGAYRQHGPGHRGQVQPHRGAESEN